MGSKSTGDLSYHVVQRYNNSSSSYSYYFWVVLNETYNQSTNQSTVTYSLWFDNATGYNGDWWNGTNESYQPYASLYVGGVYRTYGYVRSSATAYNPAAGQNYHIATWTYTHTHNADGSYSTTCGVTTTAGTGAYSQPYGPASSSATEKWTISTTNGFFTQPKVITYSANGGSSTPSTQYYATSAVTVASAISRSTATSTASVNISYNANGGSSTPSTQTSTKTTKTTYTFNGWHEGSATGTNHSAGSSFSPSANVTLVAGWNTSTTTTYSAITLAASIARTSSVSKTTITTSFNVNGGTSAAPGALTSTKTTTQPYTFNKWAKGSASGTTYNAGASYTPDGATTMYATWTNGTATTSYSAITLPAAPTRTGWTFNGWYTASSGGTKAGNAGASYTPTANGTLFAQWTQNNYTVYIRPNGGNYGGNASNQTLSNKHYGDTITLSEPTRPGYTFLGWLKNGSGSLAKHNTTNPTFNGSSSVGVYNNSGNGAVTHALVTGGPNTTYYGTHDVKISVANNTTSPGLGGFYQTQASAANKKFIHFFYAKVPTGYNVEHSQNATGDGRTITWLTDTAGSGDYKLYAYQHNCGSSGTFSTFGHVYIVSGTKPMEWQLSFSSIMDITNGKTDTFTVGTGTCYLTAMWAVNTYTLTFDPNTGTCSTTTKSVTYGNAYTDLPKPTKTGYKFMGWFVQCANTAGTALNWGKSYKWADKFALHFVTYSTDYSGWGSYRLISCTEGGGWNIENGSSCPRLAVYDATAAAYKTANFSTTWANIKPGFHRWDVVFGSKVLTAYLDGVSQCTITLDGNNIGYNANNSIWIGGEASGSDTAPTSPYLNGYIGNCYITHNTTRLNILARQYFRAPAQNVTLHAMWEPYMNIYIKGQSSGWVNIKQGQNWQN